MSQVALVGGIREGVRDVLRLLSPESIIKLAARKAGGSFMDAINPVQKRWSLFAERHRDLAGDEEQLTQVLFGKAFARAYAVVARGGGEAESDPTDDDAD